MTFYKKLLIALLGIVSCFVFYNYINNNNLRPHDNKIIFGTSADNPPYEFIDNGQVVGFDIDLAFMIAKELGKEPIIQNVDFAGLLPLLLTNNIDAAIAALTVNDARTKNVDFSSIYAKTEIAIIFHKSDKLDANSALNDKIIGAQFGSIWETIATELASKASNAKVRSLPSNLTLITELLAKNIDLVVMEKIQSQRFCKTSDELDYFVLESHNSEFAIALPKNSELTVQINRALETLKKNGQIELLKNKWLN
ncbi:MAG: ABC transporter substrate-binding protein [Rickettsiaceae bacterium]|nr:ABC transporter substrate-binding protein [Rickettsiaceae bacterium]